MTKKNLSFRTGACIMALAVLLSACSRRTSVSDDIVSENVDDANIVGVEIIIDAENGNDKEDSIDAAGIVSAEDIDKSNNGYSEAEQIYELSAADVNTESSDAQTVAFGGSDIYPITRGGTYLVTGNQSGQIYIDVKDEIVHLIMDNAFLHTYGGPAIYVKSAAKVVITVPEGTRSAISDSTNYAGYQNARACIFSNSDLTFNGSGTLVVTGYYKDAIRTKDTLKILGLDLEVQSKKDGLRGNDGVIIENAAVDLECEGNGIYTKEDKKDGRGFVSVTSGSVNVIAGKYGIRSAEDIYLNDSVTDIYGVLGDYYCMGEIFIQEDLS